MIRTTTEIRHRVSGGEFRVLKLYEERRSDERVTVMIGDGDMKVEDVQAAYQSNDNNITANLRRDRWYPRITRDDAMELLKLWQARCELDGYDCIITTIVRNDGGKVQ